VFDENSIVVQAWVRKINQGAVTLENVPALFNLHDVVAGILDENNTNVEVE
jgi:hypothetical protein